MYLFAYEIIVLMKNS